MDPVVDTAIRPLGPCLHDSPLALNAIRGDRIGNFISDKTRVREQVEILPGTPADGETFFEKAGPRQKIFFEPRKTRAAMGDLVVRNLAAYFAGDPLLTPIA